MDPILLTGALFIGGFIGDLTLRRGLVIYRFGLLIAIQWYKEGKLVSCTPVIRYTLIILFLAALLISVTWVVVMGYPDYIVPYLTGAGVMYFYGRTKSIESNQNIDNFVKYNIEFIKNDDMDVLKKNHSEEGSFYEKASSDMNDNDKAKPG